MNINWLALIIFVVMVGAFIFERIRHDKEMARKDEMLAAKSYQEFKYYHGKGLYKDELKELKVLRDEARDEREKTFEEVDITAPKVQTLEEAKLAAFDEDWDNEEIDEKVLKEKLGIKNEVKS